MTDPLRPPISDLMRMKVNEAFAIVPDDKSGALLFMVDKHGPRLHVAHRLTDPDARVQWKVGAVVYWLPGTSRPDGYVGVEASW